MKKTILITPVGNFSSVNRFDLYDLINEVNNAFGWSFLEWCNMCRKYGAYSDCNNIFTLDLT